MASASSVQQTDSDKWMPLAPSWDESSQAAGTRPKNIYKMLTSIGTKVLPQPRMTPL